MRELVDTLKERGVSERMACKSVGIGRSTYQYESRGDGWRTVELTRRPVGLSREHERYGYRRITAVSSRGGGAVNHKRVWRVWKSEGLSLPRRRPKKRRTGQKQQLPIRVEYRGHAWTYDFVFDRTESNRVLKMLVVLDEYTGECHRIRVGYSRDNQAELETLAN